MALAAALSAAISQRNAWANPLCSQTTARAVRSGSAIARFLGHELAEHHGQRGGEHEREHGGGGGRRRPLGQAQRGEAGHEERGDGGLGDVAGDQRGDRDGELAAGELERQVAVGALRRRGPGGRRLVATCRVDLAAFQRGEGELGRDGDRGAEREGDDGEQAERGEQDGHRRRPLPGICGGHRVRGPGVVWSPGRRCVRWARGAPPPGCPGVRAASVGRGGGSRQRSRRARSRRPIESRASPRPARGRASA